MSKVVENNRPDPALNLPLHSSVSQRFFWDCMPSASTPGHFDLSLAAQKRSRTTVHFWSQGPQSVQLLQLPWRASWKVQYRGKSAYNLVNDIEIQANENQFAGHPIMSVSRFISLGCFIRAICLNFSDDFRDNLWWCFSDFHFKKMLRQFYALGISRAKK